MDPVPPASVVKPGAHPNAAAMQFSARRCEYNSELRHAALDEADVDGVVIAAATEFLCPVERIDKKVGVVVRRNPSCGDFLFGDHWHARRRSSQRSQDDKFRRAIGFRDRGAILLLLDLEAPAHD